MVKQLEDKPAGWYLCSYDFSNGGASCKQYVLYWDGATLHSAVQSTDDGADRGFGEIAAPSGAMFNPLILKAEDSTLNLKDMLGRFVGFLQCEKAVVQALKTAVEDLSAACGYDRREFTRNL